MAELARTAPPRTRRVSPDPRARAARCGIKLGDDTREMVERRLIERLQALGAARTFAEYCRYLRDGDARASRDRARDRAAHHQRDVLLPRGVPAARVRTRGLAELQRAARVERALDVWSAGCSTGEEAYTIAILIARSRSVHGWNVRVIGSDISRRVLHGRAQRRLSRRELSRDAARVRARTSSIAGRAATVEPEVRSTVPLRPPQPARRRRAW